MKAAKQSDLVETDGRRLRAEQSRQRIVDAMLWLIGSGEMNPSAAQVAEEAGVGLRSVFRHFEDMDALYREMSVRIEAEIMPLVREPFDAKDWRGKLDELVTRRARVFERIMPYRVAAASRRFQSEFLMQDQRRAAELERAMLLAILPKATHANAARLEALVAVTSFEFWRTLRQDQGLSPKQAEAAVRGAVAGLVG
jgi:AcrR family transcriptional regulator